MLQQPPKRGDVVIYRKAKRSTRPGPRAKEIYPATQGDDYTYFVDKFWVVADVGEDGTLVLRTREGKLHEVSPTDPNLRRTSLWDRLWFGPRFPQL